MTLRPRVSVIVPTFNAELTPAEAIGSIEAQHCEDYEIVVVDDGLTDGTARVVDGLDVRARYLWQETRGPSAARNVGLEVTLIYRRRLADDIDANRRHIANLAGAIKRSLDACHRERD